MDSNAPPQIRGIPFQCRNDRMIECMNAAMFHEFMNLSKHDRDWNDPPDREIYHCYFEGGTTEKSVPFHRDGMRFLSAFGMTEETIWLSDKIRGNPYALRDTKSLAGGRPMINN